MLPLLPETVVSKVWIIQEMALSNHLVLLWGDEMIGWDVLRQDCTTHVPSEQISHTF